LMDSRNKERIPDFAAIDFPEYDEELYSLRKEADILKPPCPKCGGTNIRSRGLSWVCNVCKSWFLKNPKLVGKVVEIPEGLKCPECEGLDISSKGMDWRCKDCGRHWRKDGRRNREKKKEGK